MQQAERIGGTVITPFGAKYKTQTTVVEGERVEGVEPSESGETALTANSFGERALNGEGQMPVTFSELDPLAHSQLTPPPATETSTTRGGPSSTFDTQYVRKLDGSRNLHSSDGQMTASASSSSVPTVARRGSLRKDSKTYRSANVPNLEVGGGGGEALPIITIEDGDEKLYGVEAQTRPACCANERPVRVLALDGGGLRGCFTVTILKELFRDETGKEVDISEMFDLVVGTSTGGLLAAGMANGKSLIECDELYDTVGKDVFTDHSMLPETLWSGLKWTMALDSPESTSRYSTQALEELVREFLNNAEAKMNTHEKRPHCCLVATRTDVSLQQPYLFRTYSVESSLDGRHYPGTALLKSPPGTHVAKWWEACRATSAAPGYFQPIEVEIDENGNKGTFEDGGILANDPALIGCIEAGALYPNRPIVLVSIGTGKMSEKEVKAPSGPVSWASRLADGLSSGSETLHRMCCRWLLQEGTEYFRFNENMTKTDMADADALKYWRGVAETYVGREDVREALTNVREQLCLWGKEEKEAEESVRSASSSSVPTAPRRVSLRKDRKTYRSARAMRNYCAACDGAMDLTKHEIIEITGNVNGNGWILARKNMDGEMRKGFVPMAYLESVSENVPNLEVGGGGGASGRICMSARRGVTLGDGHRQVSVEDGFGSFGDSSSRCEALPIIEK